MLVIFFNSMAKTLVNYSESWYLSRIFHSLFHKLFSIFIFLLHTFSMGEKTSARLHRASLLCAVVFSASHGTRKLIRAIYSEKMGVAPAWQSSTNSKRGHTHFFNWLACAYVPKGAERTLLRIMVRSRSLPVKSRTGFLSDTECMEEEYEYANELVKKGVKNPRQVPRFTIIHQRFSHAIEKITKISTPTQFCRIL